jgi:hypothetical protein
MANRATKIVSAVFVSAVVGIPVSTFARDAAAGPDASTADSSTAVASNSTECLTTPNREALQGQRWYYRLEPGTNKRCWYLREQPERAAQTTSTRSNSSQFPPANAAQSLPATTPPAAKTFSRNGQASRSLSNARAELGARASSVETTATIVKTPVFITTGSAGTQGISATRSSSESSDVSVSSPFPDGSTADGPNTNANLNTGLSLPAVPDMPAMGNMPQEKASASLQVLFLVILGALAFAGIVASLTHRMARTWRKHHPRSRRRSIWPGADGGRRGPWAAVAAASGGGNQDRRAAGAQRDVHPGQIKRFLTLIANGSGGKSKKRVSAKPQAASATRARTPSSQRGVRASAARP